MNKLETLNREVQRRGVVTADELMDIAANILDMDGHGYQYLFTEYISKLLDRGYIARPRRGLYVAVEGSGPGGRGSEADRHIIASKLRVEYYLGFHTALELHGCAYSWFRTVTVCVRHGEQFRPFEFQGVTYRAASTAHPALGVESVSKAGHELHVSDPSRTFIDCIDRPGLAGGWEEVLKSLSGLPGVKGDELLCVLKAFGRKVLYRKAGLVLGLLGSSIYYEGVLDGINEELQRRTRGQPMYMDRKEPGPLNEEWNIYEVPNLGKMLEGV